MKLYTIQNQLGKTYKKFFQDVIDANFWVIDNLDLSNSWSITLFETDIQKIKN
jgi:hypothetical protein